MDSTRRQNADAVEPELKRLEESIVEMRDEVERADATVEALRKSKVELNGRVGALKLEKQRCSEELAATRIELGKIKSDPDRLAYVLPNCCVVPPPPLPSRGVYFVSCCHWWRSQASRCTPVSL